MHLRGVPNNQCLIENANRAFETGRVKDLGLPSRRTDEDAVVWRCSVADCPVFMTGIIQGNKTWIFDEQESYFKEIGLNFCQVARHAKKFKQPKMGRPPKKP